MLTVAGILGGMVLLYGLVIVAQPILLSRFGLLIGIAGTRSAAGCGASRRGI